MPQEEMTTNTIRKIGLWVLCAAGIAQVLLGVLVGHLRIYACEALMAQDLGIRTEEGFAKYGSAFNHYIRLLKDQWDVVTWTGLLTLFGTGLLLWAGNKQKRQT